MVIRSRATERKAGAEARFPAAAEEDEAAPRR